MKKLCILLACLVSGSLLAESVGKINFQFPPSANDWVLLTEQNGQDENNPEFNCKVYTHKEGNTLELFSALWIEGGFDSDDDEEDDEEEIPFFTALLNQELSSYFPNHQLVILNQAGTEDAKLIEWEVTDGVQTIVNGLTRAVAVEGEYAAVLNYFTTAVKSNLNDGIWLDMLISAEIDDSK